MQLDIPLYEESFAGSTVEKSYSWYFFFFFVFSLSCSPPSRYLYAEAPSENEVEQRPLSFLFLSPSPLSPPLFLSFLLVRLFSIDSFRTRYNTQRIEIKRNAANYIMRGLGRKRNDNRRS